MKNAVFVFLSVIVLTSCGPSAEESYSSGRSDGQAVGYNTACKIRATMIAGRWDDKEYARGYADGVTAGIIQCVGR